MLQLEPISTSNLITLIQIFVVLCGFVFSWRSLEATRTSVGIATDSLKNASKNLELATANAQAQLYNQMVAQGRELQYRFMELYHGAESPEDIAARQNIYTGIVIGYYAACFELRNVLTLPHSVEKLLSAELRELMRQSPIKKRWEDVKHFHSKEFVAYVNSLIGV